MSTKFFVTQEKYSSKIPNFLRNLVMGIFYNDNSHRRRFAENFQNVACKKEKRKARKREKRAVRKKEM